MCAACMCLFRIAKLGLKPTLKADLPSGVKYPYVLFSAPPSGAADYAAEVNMPDIALCLHTEQFCRRGAGKLRTELPGRLSWACLW